MRALYNYTRSEAYAVGEYQIEDLGNPKLIILPSPYLLTDHAWQTILDRVKAGAVLLTSGIIDNDPHFHATGWQKEAGLNYSHGLLTARENVLHWPGGEARLTYSGNKTTFLDRAFLADGSTWTSTNLGQGKVLFFALPLELNDNMQAIADVYKWAEKQAGITPTYATNVSDPGVLICPTQLPEATLYVVTSESGTAANISFQDEASKQSFSANIEPGRAAMLLVENDGRVTASYGWK